MNVTLTSALTGKQHTRNIPADQPTLDMWLAMDHSIRPFVQDAFPDLSEDDREFLVSGTTPEEWQQFMAELDDAEGPL